MIHWIEINKDGLISNIIISAVFLPIAYIFTVLMNRWKSNAQKPMKSKMKNKNRNIKHPESIENERPDVPQVIIRPIPTPGENKQTTDPYVWIIGLIIALGFGIKYYIPNKMIIVNIIYLISIFSFFLCLIKACKEFNNPSAKGIGQLLLWNALMWLFLLFLMHLTNHPVYYTKEIQQAEISIINGSGILEIGINNFMYFGYQVIGVTCSIILLLFNIGAQLFVLFLWWNNSSNGSSLFKNKFLKLFMSIYYPKRKYIFTSILLVLFSFGFTSGLLMKLIQHT